MGASALIMAGPGPLRDGLEALVGTMPQIGAVEAVSDLDLTFRKDCELRPSLVLLDADLADGRVWLTVRRARAKWPQARTVVLAQGIQQQEEAEAAGADVVLLHGFPAGKLVAAIVKLLPQAGV